MPLNAIGWTNEEDEKLIELVEPHKHLYSSLDHSRKNIIARENTWQTISNEIFKPVDECKKRWRGLRDSFTRSKRMGSIHRSKVPIYGKLQFLDSGEMENDEQILGLETEVQVMESEQVITDSQEYYEHDYEVTLSNDAAHQELDLKPKYIKIMPKTLTIEHNSMQQPQKKVVRKNAGRKRSMPLPRNIPPVKILPKPIIMSEPRIIKYVDDKKGNEDRSQVIDMLIEKVLKENTNEIDVFFRSMAASVKKLQPNLIPKVKMEVCNVIAKYEMQSFDKNLQNI
ncbi:uncharacterized protein LOC112046057 [Bicyclus anynana]|uniref:Uncharacterized protein LOC112046057 n=1 Tax=Bicyclus anynana TaxID=110368 RepID=A0A6J1MZF0_BICAN|nr:uncharacterized protein LOC112046057 [Bicyclus anynana]